MGLKVTFQGGPEFRNQLAALSIRVASGTEIATKEGAFLIAEAIKENMHGPMPPKAGGSDPAMRTGNLISAVKIKPIAGGIGLGRWQYEISMDQGNAPYAARIELGFTGVDSIGRNYDQPPYPYFSKGIDTAIGAEIIGDLFFENWERATH